MSEAPSVRFPFWLKLLVFGGVLAIIPTTVVGVRALNQLQETLNTDSRAYRAAVVSDVADRVERILLDSTNTLVGVALTLSDRELDSDLRIRVATSLLESDDTLDHIFIFDKTGKRIDTMTKASLSWEIPKTELSEETLKLARDNETSFSAPLDEPRVLGVVPIRVDGNVTGYVGSYVPVTNVISKLESIARSQPPAPNAVYVVDRHRRIIAHPDTEKIGTVLGENALRNNLNHDVTFEQNVTQAGEFTDDRQEAMVGSLKPLQFVDWAVVIENPISAVYASYYSTRDLLVVTIVIALLIAIVLALLLSRRMTRPIGQLVQFSRKLADRDFDARTDVATADEMGVLSHALESAAFDLKESEEAIRKEIEIRSDLGRFLPKDLVDGIVSREKDLELGGERATITVLFADVVSFTEMCNDNDPAVVVEILNELFTILTEIVFKNNGTVDKFLGDCIMAFWGAPNPNEHHAEDAINAAEEMMRFVEFGNDKWKKEHGIKIELAIGVHSGTAIVGNVGSDTRMEYTAIGQTVNIAARMEALARPNQILTTEATHLLLPDVDMASIGVERINTKGTTIEIFEVAQ